MEATLTQQRRVKDEGFRIVNFCRERRRMTVSRKKAPANYVPAAAVIRRGRALSGFIGRKACVGGLLSLRLKPEAQPRFVSETGRLECGRGKWNF